MSSSQPDSPPLTNGVLPHETTSWTTLEVDRWEARSGRSHIGTVVFTHRYEVLLRSGEVIGEHTSLESAKAQLEAWMRWTVGGRPFSPALAD